MEDKYWTVKSGALQAREARENPYKPMTSDESIIGGVGASVSLLGVSSQKPHVEVKEEPEAEFGRISTISINTSTDSTKPPSPELKESKEKGFMQQLGSSDSTEFSNPKRTRVLLDGKYELEGKISEGSFGNVFKGRDIKSNCVCAIKVIKSKHMQKGSNSILREVKILCDIYKLDDSPKKRFIVKLFRAFSFQNNLCIVFELLGPSLTKVLNNEFRRGFSLEVVQKIGIQIASGINFLHENGFVHHDIKPDNVVFQSFANDWEWDCEEERKVMRSLDIRIIDFGSTTHSSEGRVKTATTRVYRSPEMTFHCLWNAFSDVWALGCTLFELYTGHLLFRTTNEVKKCFMLQAMFGPIPLQFGLASKLDCFDKNGRLIYDGSTIEHYKCDEKLLSFKDMLTKYRKTGDNTSTFLDLLSRMLMLKPHDRINSEEILKHGFWTEEIPRKQY